VLEFRVEKDILVLMVSKVLRVLKEDKVFKDPQSFLFELHQLNLHQQMDKEYLM
jgi:hypothetical protein